MAFGHPTHIGDSKAHQFSARQDKSLKQLTQGGSDTPICPSLHLTGCDRNSTVFPASDRCCGLLTSHGMRGSQDKIPAPSRWRGDLDRSGSLGRQPPRPKSSRRGMPSRKVSALLRAPSLSRPPEHPAIRREDKFATTRSSSAPSSYSNHRLLTNENLLFELRSAVSRSKKGAVELDIRRPNWFGVTW